MPKVRMYAIFYLTRRYGNESGNSRSAASGTLGKFCVNKREGFTFCVTVDANWIVFRPKQVRLLVEHFENKLQPRGKPSVQRKFTKYKMAVARQFSEIPCC